MMKAWEFGQCECGEKFKDEAELNKHRFCFCSLPRPLSENSHQKKETKLESEVKEEKIEVYKTEADLDIDPEFSDKLVDIFSSPISLIEVPEIKVKVEITDTENIKVPENTKRLKAKKVSSYCNECGEGLYGKASLNDHRRDHEEGLVKPMKLNCNECDEVFPNKKLLREHVREHREGPKPKIIHDCKECGMVLNSLNELKIHIEVEHIKPIKYNFELYETKEEAIINANAGLKTFPCKECESIFIYKAQLKGHIKAHKTGIILYHCTKCEAFFNEFDDFQIHKFVNHDIPNEKCYKKNAVPPSKRAFTCKLCPHKTPTNKDMEDHMKDVHSFDSSVQSYICNLCSHKTQNKTKHKIHKSLHAPPTLPCQDCGKLFHADRYLNSHINRCHSPEDKKPHRCDECGKGFMGNGALEEHLNVHLGRKPFTCPHCGMSYANSSNMSAHWRKAHPETHKEGRKSVKVKK